MVRNKEPFREIFSPTVRLERIMLPAWPRLRLHNMRRPSTPDSDFPAFQKVRQPVGVVQVLAGGAGMQAAQKQDFRNFSNFPNKANSPRIM